LSIKKIVKKQTAEVIIKINPLKVHEPSGKPVVTSVANIVLFFNCSSPEEIESITTFLVKIDNNFNIGHVLVYSNLDKIANKKMHNKIKIITDDDFNIFGGLKQDFDDWLSNNNFDILISFADDCDLFCNKIIANISAVFKAGSFNKENLDLFDLTINNAAGNYTNKFEHFIHYINKLNINT